MRRREAAGLTQQDLASRLGYTRAWVAKLEHGSVYTVPPMAKLLAIAEATDTPLPDLLDAAGFQWDNPDGKIAAHLAYFDARDEYITAHPDDPLGERFPAFPDFNTPLTLAPEDRHTEDCLDLLARGQRGPVAEVSQRPRLATPKKLHATCFGHFIRERRRRLGFSAEQLAESLDMSVSRLTAFERGEFKKLPSWGTAIGLATRLHVSEDDLLDAAGVALYGAKLYHPDPIQPCDETGRCPQPTTVSERHICGGAA